MKELWLCGTKFSVFVNYTLQNYGGANISMDF